VTVRRDGHSVSATFPSKKPAQIWANEVENDIVRATETGFAFNRERWLRRGRPKTVKETIGDVVDAIDRLARERNPDTDPTPRRDWTLDRAFEHYVATVTSTKKGSAQEKLRVAAWRRHTLAARKLTEITPGHIQQHVNERLAQGRAAMTIRNEVFLLSGLYTHAAKLPPPPPNQCASSGWGLTDLANPVRTVELPEPPPGRDRRLQDSEDVDQPGEEQRMLSALREGPDGDLMAALFVFAVETGMRLSEILSVYPAQVLKTDGVRYVAQPDSKNGKPRFVILSTRALAVIEDLLKPARTAGRQIFDSVRQCGVIWRGV